MYEARREIRNIGIITGKELRENVGLLRYVIVGALYLIFVIVTVSQTATEDHSRGVAPLMSVISTMSNINFLLIILAMIISADVLSTEKKDRTIYQLLSKPVERSSIVLGKLIACICQMSALFIAGMIIAYALTIILIGQVPGTDDLIRFAGAIGAEIPVLVTYIAIGILISTLTGNPLVSIIGALIAWATLSFAEMAGSNMGMNAVQQQVMTANYIGDPSNVYPLFDKMLIWADPMSHNMMTQIAGGNWSATFSGLPLWAHVAIALAYAVALAALSVVLFSSQDLA